MTTSDNSGTYRFQNIDVGMYTVTLRVPGFKTLTQTGMAVSAGEAHNAGKMFLALGQVSESITVNGSRLATAPGPTVQSSGPMTTLGPLNKPGPQANNAGRYRAINRVLVKSEQAGAGGGPVRIGGNVQASKIISQVKPVYPVDLQQEGVRTAVSVKVEAVEQQGRRAGR